MVACRLISEGFQQGAEPGPALLSSQAGASARAGTCTTVQPAEASMAALHMEERESTGTAAALLLLLLLLLLLASGCTGSMATVPGAALLQQRPGSAELLSCPPAAAVSTVGPSSSRASLC